MLISILTCSLLFIASSCDKEKGENSTGGQSLKGEQKTLTFTPFMELNQSADAINSHEEDYSRSALKMMYNTLQVYVVK